MVILNYLSVYVYAMLFFIEKITYLNYDWLNNIQSKSVKKQKVVPEYV